MRRRHLGRHSRSAEHDNNLKRNDLPALEIGLIICTRLVAYVKRHDTLL